MVFGENSMNAVKKIQENEYGTIEDFGKDVYTMSVVRDLLIEKNVVYKENKLMGGSKFYLTDDFKKWLKTNKIEDINKCNWRMNKNED